MTTAIDWHDVATTLAAGDLPDPPGLVTRSALLDQWKVDPQIAMRSLRSISAWSTAPHDGDDFRRSLDWWHAPGHVAWHHAKFTHARRGNVAVASCCDCGRPVWTLTDHEPIWVPLWPEKSLAFDVERELRVADAPDGSWQEDYEIEHTRDWAAARLRCLRWLVEPTGEEQVRIDHAHAALHARLGEELAAVQQT